jgi:hypothetical protein
MIFRSTMAVNQERGRAAGGVERNKRNDSKRPDMGPRQATRRSETQFLAGLGQAGEAQNRRCSSRATQSRFGCE